MAKKTTCDNCRHDFLDDSMVLYHSNNICKDCYPKIDGKEPQIKQEQDPLLLINEHYAKIMHHCKRSRKILAKYGYYYKCPYCFFVSVDLNPLCSKCQTTKILNNKSLNKDMPLGWT